MAEVELPNPEELHELSGDRFTKGVALMVAVYAVALAITALGGSNAGKEAMLAQQQSSNAWAYYQAKAGREYSARIALKRLTLDKPDAKELLADFAADATKYESEKVEIEKKARHLEAERDLNMKKDPYFDYAEVLLQIAIVLASVSMLAKSRPAFLFSVVVAVSGAFLSFNGFTLLVAVPGLGH